MNNNNHVPHRLYREMNQRLEAERVRAARVEAARLEQVAREQAEREQAEREQAERERVAREWAELERQRELTELQQQMDWLLEQVRELRKPIKAGQHTPHSLYREAREDEARRKEAEAAALAHRMNSLSSSLYAPQGTWQGGALLESVVLNRSRGEPEAQQPGASHAQHYEHHEHHDMHGGQHGGQHDFASLEPVDFSGYTASQSQGFPQPQQGGPGQHHMQNPSSGYQQHPQQHVTHPPQQSVTHPLQHPATHHPSRPAGPQQRTSYNVKDALAAAQEERSSGQR